MHIVAGRDPRYFCKKSRSYDVTRRNRCDRQGMRRAAHQSAGLSGKPRNSQASVLQVEAQVSDEDEQSLVPAGFVPMMPGAAPIQSVPTQKSKGKQQKPQNQESFLTVEIRTSCGSAMRIQGNMTAAHLREIISASNV